MSISETLASAHTETSSGLFAEAVGGIATIVLSIIALAGTHAAFLLAIATIVFGAALLIEGASVAADYAHMRMEAPGVMPHVGTGGLAAVFLGGVTGIILGVLALIGIAAPVMTSVASIVFGSALLLSAGSTMGLHELKVRMSGDVVAADMMSSTAAAQALTGVAAIVLGIVAVAGTLTEPLALIALLVLGAGMLMTGNGMNNAMIGMFHGSSAQAR